jgi:hypothetical protein
MKRNENATCENCPYYHELRDYAVERRHKKETGEEQIFVTGCGWCRRNAPPSKVIIAPDGFPDQGDIHELSPQTHDKYWCGEHPDFLEAAK